MRYLNESLSNDLTKPVFLSNEKKVLRHHLKVTKALWQLSVGFPKVSANQIAKRLHVHSTWHLRQQVTTGKPTKWCQLVKILSILKFSFTPYNGVFCEARRFTRKSISNKFHITKNSEKVQALISTENSLRWSFSISHDSSSKNLTFDSGTIIYIHIQTSCSRDRLGQVKLKPWYSKNPQNV